MIVDLNTSATVQANWWLQERLILRLETSADSAELRWYNNATDWGTIATYIVVDGAVEIDITDYARANTDKNRYMVKTGIFSAGTVEIARVGLINPEGMIIPPIELDARFGVLITPPSKIIRAFAYTYGVEFYAKPVGFTWQYRMNNSAWQNMPNGVTMMGRTDLSRIQIGHSNIAFITRTITERNCGHRYADISWVSAVGMDRTLNGRKLHTWEVRAQEIASAGDYSLLDWDNSYNTVKGREDGFTLVLDELDAYDMWYYSDIITSSDVRLFAIDGWAAQSESEMVRLEVVGKSVTLPNGTALGKMEIQVKFKRYDAVSL